MNQEEIRQKIAELGRTNLFFLTKAILYPERKSTHPPFVYDEQLHRELAFTLEDSNYSKKLIMIPRGHYKTTFGNARAIQWVIQNPNNRILLVGATTIGPERRLRHIRSTFEQNPLFRWLYPEVIPDFAKVPWAATQATVRRSQSFPEPTFDTAGVGTALPGRHYSKIIKDDIVNDKNSNTPDLEEQVIEWDASTIPLFDAPEDPSNEELVIGTPWTSTDLYSRKRRDPDYAIYIRHSLENEKGEPDFDAGNPIFPSRFSRKRLEAIRARLENDELFYCQYMCDPHGGTGEFLREYIRYYDSTPIGLEVSITVDPGGIRENSDPAAFTVVGVDYQNNWYVLQTLKRRMNPREQIDMMFTLFDLWGPHTIGIETVAWQKALRFFAEEEMRRRNKFLPIKELKTDSRVSKEMRIRGLIPRFSAHSIFLKRDMRALEDELFGRVRTDDLKDALAYQLQVATIWPQKEEKVENNPFSMMAILEELGRRKQPEGMILEANLTDSYEDTQNYFKQLRMDN